LFFLSCPAGERFRRRAECRLNFTIGENKIPSRFTSYYPNINDTMAKDTWEIMILPVREILP
jgi:hypothetical protein